MARGIVFCFLSENFRYSKFVAYKVKDAIVDYFREKAGQRPNISVTNPGIRFHIHISDDDCTLSLDSSGESLHKRGWRTATVDAPMNEILAAGLVMLTGWKGDCDFIDPMCGSGTIAIEACMLARNIAPGRKKESDIILQNSKLLSLAEKQRPGASAANLPLRNGPTSTPTCSTQLKKTATRNAPSNTWYMPMM